MFQLRDYQKGACDEFVPRLVGGGLKPLVVMPTGSGKSPVMAETIRRLSADYPDVRVGVIAHVQELVEQNHAAFVKHCPQYEAQAGIYAAGLKRRDSKRVNFMSLQSVYNKVDELGEFHVILVDEAHIIPSKGRGMIRTFLDDCQAKNGGMMWGGLTATPYRLDHGMLTVGDEAAFDFVCFNVPIRPLVERGYLCPLRTPATPTHYNLEGVKRSGGEFTSSSLNERLDESQPVTKEACDHIVSQWEKHKRRSALTFCASIAQAELVTEALNARGLGSVLVTGKTPKAERRRIVEGFKEGTVTNVVNVGVFTTGFDAPNVDMINDLRPTMSPGLHVQKLGRGLRVSDKKDFTLVLDFCENIAVHGPIDQVKPPVKKGTRVAEVKEETLLNEEVLEGTNEDKMCPECNFARIPLAERQCPTCGYWFKLEESFNPVFLEVDPMSEKTRDWLDVTKVMYALHEKEGKPPSVKVTYVCGIERVSEWVCIEHDGYAGRRALNWFERRIRDEDFMPMAAAMGVKMGLSGDLKEPRKIHVDYTGSWPSVIGYRDLDWSK